MNAALVEEIATHIVNQTIVAHLEFYAVGIAVTILASALAAFGGAYWRIRGEQKATKAVFDDLLDQLKRSTAVTEKVRSDVLHELHQKQTTPVLYREKIEQLFELTYSLEASMDADKQTALAGDKPTFDMSSMGRIQTLVGLYFPAVFSESLTVHEAALNFCRWSNDLYGAKFRLARPPDGQTERALQETLDRYGDIYGPLLDSTVAFRERVLAAYRGRAGIPD